MCVTSVSQKSLIETDCELYFRANSAYNADGNPLNVSVGGYDFRHTYRYEDSNIWDDMSTRTYAAIYSILGACFDVMENHVHPTWHSSYEDYFPN